MHDFLNFQLEACARRVEDSKTISWIEGATILRTFQVLKDVGMFFRGEMFTDANGEVSIGFTNITDTAACTHENWVENSSHRGNQIFLVSLLKEAEKFLEYSTFSTS